MYFLRTDEYFTELQDYLANYLELIDVENVTNEVYIAKRGFNKVFVPHELMPLVRGCFPVDEVKLLANRKEVMKSFVVRFMSKYVTNNRTGLDELEWHQARAEFLIAVVSQVRYHFRRMDMENIKRKRE